MYVHIYYVKQTLVDTCQVVCVHALSNKHGVALPQENAAFLRNISVLWINCDVRTKSVAYSVHVHTKSIHIAIIRMIEQSVFI